MSSDRKVLYIISLSSFALLLTLFFLPAGSGRVLAALLMLPLAVISLVFIKKRSIFSFNKRQVLLLMSVIGVLYVVLYYLTGFYFGFYRTGYYPNAYYIFHFILPIATVIVCSELIRGVALAQNSKFCSAVCYLTCVLAEVMICSGFNGIVSYAHFMDVVGLTFFPAIISNILYHYLARRYGAYPNIVYRLFITLYTYIIPYKPLMADSLYAFLNLLIPLAIFLFIDALFEKKESLALGKKGKATLIATVLSLVMAAFTVMLISNQFGYGMLVIATESMTGELNVGDAVIYEDYDDQTVKEGQVIVFEKSKTVFVHRVVEIEYIDGVKRYYTKGDYNEDRDSGYITDSQIVGTVSTKLPYIGYPSLWIRQLFSK